MTPVPVKVAVIGCGPSGMSFLHAVAHHHKRMEKKGCTPEEIAAALPDVTCFERSSSPGGVWRSDRSSKEKHAVGEDAENIDSSLSKSSTNMYEALWTNGPKECMEFFDYTFDEHFGCAMPAFMPRQLILDYLLARCTRHNANFFDNVKFNTSVMSVTFNDELEQFIVQTVDHETGIISEGMFHKCIWAAGDNGVAKIPKTISNILSAGGYKGRVMHSSETGSVDFRHVVEHSKILIIGDAYSAEDLALQAINLGVETIDICSRSGEGVASYTGSWPMDKVTIHYPYMIKGVTGDGVGITMTSGGEDNEDTIITLDGIETVIYCTGYLQNMDMLDPSLRPSSRVDFSEYDIPEDWKMPRNSLSDEFGDIPVGKILESNFIWHDMYRGHLMSNSSMMFLMERLDLPLLDLDVSAWLLLASITGQHRLPGLKDMKKFNLNLLLDELADPTCRANEENYKKRWDEVALDHWSWDASDLRTKEIDKMHLNLHIRILARDMIDADYPLCLGTYDMLNEKGDALVEFNEWSTNSRVDLDEESPDASWRTFRDCTPTTYSLMTGTKAVPLLDRWLSLDGQGKGNIVDQTAQK